MNSPQVTRHNLPQSLAGIEQVLTVRLGEKKIKSVNMWQSYKQERDCLVHFLLLLAVCWPGAQSARNNHVLSDIFTDLKKFTQTE